MAKLVTGTSGFSYPAWKPAFYPQDLPAKKFLNYYSTRLNGVEINYTYHRLPSASTVENWLEDTGPGFVFVLKAHQKLTHIQRLQRSEFTQVFFKSVDALRIKGRLGPVLFQAPPNLALDLDRLRGFLEDFPADVRCAFEFRNKSWFTEPVYDLLESKGIALCLAESDKLTVPERVTADFVYFRLRKETYPPEERADFAARVKTLMNRGLDCYVFFKHEDTPDGALYAEELLKTS
ncbi:MAG: DUF72 domain-containing protein [Acidobacteria bacterium]|nr:DUF72 domain-containing protein [Acidobacteriota bacterium]